MVTGPPMETAKIIIIILVFVAIIALIGAMLVTGFRYPCTKFWGWVYDGLNPSELAKVGKDNWIDQKCRGGAIP